MTDMAMKDLVTQHDVVITSLVTSVEQLVKSQTETNKRLEEISKFLAKQVVFSSKLENLDRELSDSFKRVHKRVDEIDNIQKNENGCNSVRLLTKDIDTLTKDVDRLVNVTNGQSSKVEGIEKGFNKLVSPATIKWVIGLIILYSISFGTYVVSSISSLATNDAKMTTMLDRDIADTKVLMLDLRGK